MRLLTIHKLLIGTSIFCDTAFTAWCLFEYWGKGGTHLLWMAVFSTIVAIVFCVYFVRLIKSDPRYAALIVRQAGLDGYRARRAETTTTSSHRRRTLRLLIGLFARAWGIGPRIFP